MAEIQKRISNSKTQVTKINCAEDVFNYFNQRLKDKKEEHFYVNGKKEGHSIEWYVDGKISHEGNYKDDLKEGLWTEFSREGQKSIGQYINDKKEGEWKWYDPNGNYRGNKYYKNGKEQ